MQAMSAGKIKVVDVSNHNGIIDWFKVKSDGYVAVYAKASEGVTYNDPTYLQNVKNAKTAGLHVGAYHFARPENNDPIDEAKHFVSILKQFDTDLIPVLDLEMPTNTDLISSEDLVQWARDFVNYVTKAVGSKVMLYTGVWFIRQYDNFFNKLSDLPLWIALYGSSVPDAGGWSQWVMWQYSEKGRVNGINGFCDVNVAVSLDALLAKQVVAKPTVQAQPQPPLPLKYGDKGEFVKLLQKRLNIPADGIFLDQTEESVKEWQTVHDEAGNVVKPYSGLIVDGIVGVKTWKALFR